MTIICLSLCGLVAVIVTAIVGRDAWREIRAMRAWNLQMRHDGTAGRHK